MSLCNGKYIVYCPAFDLIWGVSPWIGEGELWIKMCPKEDGEAQPIVHDLYEERFEEPPWWWGNDHRRIDLCVNCLRPIHLIIAGKYYNKQLDIDYKWFHVHGGQECYAFQPVFNWVGYKPQHPGYVPDKAEPIKW